MAETLQKMAEETPKSDEGRRFEEFFQEVMRHELAELAEQYPQQRSLSIDFQKLVLFDHKLADGLLERPDHFLKVAEEALEGLQFPTAVGSLKAHVRFRNLDEDRVIMVQNLGAQHLDKFIAVEGIISLATEIKPVIKRAHFECLHCGLKSYTFPEKNILKTPDYCRCGRKDFKHLDKEDEFVNMQNAQMQDLVEKLKGNSPTSHISLWVEDDLVNQVAPGEKFLVTGILRKRPVTKDRKQTSVYEKLLEIWHLERSEKEFEELEVTAEEEAELVALSKRTDLFETIVKSIAPSIYGYPEMKLAIALQMFGGNTDKILPDGKRVRGEIHALLIGDPGTAKTATLQYASRLAPKCIYVSGKGTSGVGLTASAEKDEFGEGWVLKAGALVLASGGQVAVDELDKMTEDDRSAMHEALESGTISIAKAGIVTRFNARTSVLAAANPKLGRFNPAEPPANQFEIPPTLLSRFDLVFPIKDVLDEVQDSKVAEHILKGHRASLGSDQEKMDISPEISIEKLRKYIAYARRNFSPVLTLEASAKIKEYYLRLRKMGMKQNYYPVTARQIEGLIRLAEASAKARFSKHVMMIDADRAITLTEYVLRTVFMDRETGRIDSDIINIGQPKSKIDRARTVLEIIEDKERDVDMVSVEEVVKEAESLGIEEKKAREILDQLHKQAEIFRPKSGFVRTSRKRRD
ncbi:minichromosome maintenance protein MCM [Candidatus Micrarchaeota archaeon]|nr:minichromosome maintenance protein MCM [Candidatus Micrarchaeota archaeon]